jgi:hypothetical protein
MTVPSENVPPGVSTSPPTPTLGPVRPPVDARGPLGRILLRHGLAVGLVLGASFGWSAWRYGSPLGFTQALAGQSLVAERSSLACEAADPGEERLATFRLKNITSSPVRIVGMKSSCSCGTVRELPLAIAPGETASFPLRIVTRDSTAPGLLRVGVELMLDAPSTPVILETSLPVRAVPAKSGRSDAAPRVETHSQ